MTRFLCSLCLILFAASASFVRPADATTYQLDDWWLTTDGHGGLRQSTWDEDFYFAVSKFTTWVPTQNDTFVLPTGYHWATTAEAQQTFVSQNVAPNYTYYNSGGWTGYSWQGKSRYFFRFADSWQTDAYKHVGNFDSFQVQTTSNVNFFAGLVLVRDDLLPIPVPASAAMLVGGLGVLAGLRRARRGSHHRRRG